MSAITIENDLVHYEVLGRGRPVILLHGWLGSWRYWVPAMQQLSAKYRAYAVDLWGFGDSGKEPARFNFESQVDLLDQFMDKMGITKAALVGHGLGAAVITRYATLHPDRVPRLMVVSPPLFQMAPSNQSVTVSAAATRQIAASAGGNASSTPAAPAQVKAGGSEAASDKPTSTEDGKNGVSAEAETMPWRTDEMRDRIRAALEKQAKELGEAALQESIGPSAKSPIEAAKPPSDKPATEIVAAPKTSEAASESGTSGSGTAAAKPAPTESGTVQAANPLKEHLGTLNRIELLEKHVDAGADRDKLKVEVEKSHEKVLEVWIESYAGVDTLRELHALPSPAVAIYGASDTFLQAPTKDMIDSLTSGNGPFKYFLLNNARHFPMLEDITAFTRLMLDFLEIPDITKLELKKTWERRVR